MSPLPPGVGRVCEPIPSRWGGDVWLFISDLDTLPDLKALEAGLDATERRRLAQFASPGLAESFARRRWLRRRLLADFHGLDESEIRIDVDRLGRPRIVEPGPIRHLTISTSSAGRYALVAWRAGGSIGVDIARVEARHVSEDAARIFMSPTERRAWTLRQDDRVEAFFRCWTRKEAILKVMGTGFATDATSVESFSELAGHGRSDEVEVIDLVGPEIPDGWAAAMAIGRAAG